MMLPTQPTAGFIMVETDFTFAFFKNDLDGPTHAAEVHQFQHGDVLLSAFTNYITAEEATSLPVYKLDNVDPVFLSLMKVKSSSISASLASSGIGTSGKLDAYAATAASSRCVLLTC
jgi:hypothetical protein